jgi:hypothetical protein
LANYAAPNATDDDIVWADVSDENKDNWVVPIADIKFEGSNDTISKSTDDSAVMMIPDSGTSFATIP